MLTGWGRTAPSRAEVVELAGPQAVAGALAGAGPRGVIARGLGRSYNDAAQNAGGLVLRLPADRSWRLDDASGTVTCSAGAVLDDLITDLVPRGWFVPVTPGTRMVTVGGMVAADVHGKNHHADGTIGAHVSSLELVTATGATRTLAADGATAEEFWATVGGMGLTGVLTGVTLRLLPVTSAWIRAEEQRCADLDALMGALVASGSQRYSVAWIDGTPRGRSFGRGLVSTGEHAPAADLAAGTDPLALGPSRTIPVPLTPPANPLTRWTVAAFNEVWFRKPAPAEHLVGLRSFFHPLDGVAGWNRLYGPRGFVQYQFAVPDSAAGLVETALRALQSVGAASFLAVLKRFGAANPAPLSFPMPGWTLALDIPAGVPGLADVLDRLDEQVAAAGGRLYLAKDGRMRPELLPAMYPRLDQWRATRRQMDPDGVLTSDLARRLAL